MAKIDRIEPFIRRLAALLCIPGLLLLFPAGRAADPISAAGRPLLQEIQDTPEDWPMAGADPQRTGRNASEVQGELRPVWYHAFDAYISQKVQIIAGYERLYIAAADGLHALDAATGEQVWHFATELPLGHSPTLLEGVAYVGGLDGNLYALDALTGEQLWAFRAPAGFQTNPLVVDGLVLAGSRGGTFYALHTSGDQAGQKAWEFQTGGPILFSAAYRDGVVFFASNDQHAYALEAATGELVWKSEPLPGHGFHSWWPVVAGDRVIFPGSYNYRYVEPFTGPHTALDTAEAFPEGLDKGAPIGPVDRAAGPWPPENPILEADAIGAYLEANPHRRTLFVLDAASGEELTFDQDQDGAPEYAPFLWFGTHSGTRYPPVVGSDGLIYSPNALYYDKWIPRGGIVGWTPDEPMKLALPSGYGGAVDEPVGYSIGGETLYWLRCCDRTAGAYQIGGGAAANLQSWTYFNEGGRNLRRSLPDLFERGWPFAYWKHGDPSPPIPYRGLVYMVVNNAVVAFGPQGHEPVLGPDFDFGQDTGIKAEDILAEAVLPGLNVQLTGQAGSWPRLVHQETYYSTEDRPSAQARFFPLVEVAVGEAGAQTLDIYTHDFGRVLEPGDAAQLVARSEDSERLLAWVSPRAPGTLFQTGAGRYHLGGTFQALAYPTQGGIQRLDGAGQISGEALTAGWLLAWDASRNHRWMPLVISLESRPDAVRLADDGITLDFPDEAGYLAVTPLYGMAGPVNGEAETWSTGNFPPETLARVEQLDRLARAFPVASLENWTLIPPDLDPAPGSTLFIQDRPYGPPLPGESRPGPDSAILHYSTFYIEFRGDWDTPPLQMATLPPRYALAGWGESPIRANGQPLAEPINLDMLAPLGRLGGALETSTISLALPGIAEVWRSDPQADIQAGPQPGDPVYEALVQQVRAILEAGHLRPGYGVIGIWESRAENRIGDDLADYFHNPAETQLALLRARPWLPEDLQQEVDAYLQAEFEAYPLLNTAHIGWDRGAAREAFALPPEVEQAAQEFGPKAKARFNNWGLPPLNLYALYRYAQVYGQEGDLFDQAQGKLDMDAQFQASFPYALNSAIAGQIGYLRLAELAGRPRPQSAERTMIHLLLLRAALSKYPDALAQGGFEYAGREWTLRRYAPDQASTLFSPTVSGSLWSQLPLYGFRREPIHGLSGTPTGGDYAFMIDFYPLAPELGAFLKRYAGAETEAAVESYNRRAPYWFMARAEETGGEGVFQPLYDRLAYFQARALALDEPRPSLERYLDVPAFARGDLFYLENLAAVLEAGE